MITPKLDNNEKNELKKSLRKMQGADKTSNVIILEATQVNLELEKQFAVLDLAENPDDKVLEYSNSQAEANICKAFSIPVSLISGKSEGIFGNSGAVLYEMKRQVWENQEFTRTLVEETLNMLLGRFSDKIDKQSVIDPFEAQTTT